MVVLVAIMRPIRDSGLGRSGERLRPRQAGGVLCAATRCKARPPTDRYFRTWRRRCGRHSPAWLQNRLKIAGRAADNLEHLRCGGLLLQRFGEFPRALLLRLEQPRVLDGDHRLVGEGCHQLDLLVVEWPHGIALSRSTPISIPSRSSGTPRSVRNLQALRVSPKRIRDQPERRGYERFALQQNSPDTLSRPGANQLNAF